MLTMQGSKHDISRVDLNPQQSALTNYATVAAYDQLATCMFKSPIHTKLINLKKRGIETYMYMQNEEEGWYMHTYLLRLHNIWTD